MIVERLLHLDYTASPGTAQARFLKGLEQGKILGERCPKCGKVYCPPRGSCPTDGVATAEQIELAGTGTVTTFCVVNIPFAGQAVECPYVSASVLLDGADIPLFALIQEIPWEEVRMGLRVEAVWADELKPTLESIKYYRPTGEPDADYESYRANVMRNVAVVGYARSPFVMADPGRNEVEILMPVLAEAFGGLGITMDDIGFTCSGSSDYLAGQAFAFVMALDAVGPWPPIVESHVEMDGAWALYEAWVKLQMGEVDAALVYAFGKSSLGDQKRIPALQLDPYCVQPMWPDPYALAALQARAWMERTGAGEKDLAAVAARFTGRDVDELLAEPYVVSPLRAHDCGPSGDAAAAVILAAEDKARALVERPAWITGIDHRIEPHALGLRDLTVSESTRIAADRAGVADGPVDVAELHAPFSHQELILRDALGLDGNVAVGGVLNENPMMVAGLQRIGTAAQAVLDGRANRAVAHATSGHCLQQNLVAVLSAEGS